MKPFSATSRKRSQVMARFRRRSLQPRIVLVDPGGVEVVTLALEEGGGPAMLHLDHVAHLQLAAKRWGCTVRLYGASPELIELLEIFNLNQVITIVRFPG